MKSPHYTLIESPDAQDGIEISKEIGKKYAISVTEKYCCKFRGGSVWYTVSWVLYRTESYDMTKQHTNIVPNFSVYRKFSIVVFDTVTIPCFQYTIPHFGIPNCGTTYVIPEKIYYTQNIQKNNSSVRLLQKVQNNLNFITIKSCSYNYSF